MDIRRLNGRVGTELDPRSDLKRRESGRRYGLRLAQVGIGCFVLAMLCFVALAEDSSVEILEWRATTRAYNDAVFRALVAEANRVAVELDLRESLPIMPGHVLERHINSPFVSATLGLFGSITTSNYAYYASVDNKLSYIIRNLGPDDSGEAAFMEALRKKYARPKAEMDSNTARAMASRWLAAAGIDVKALDRDSKIDIRVWEVGDSFVPLYYVSWQQPYAGRDRDDHGMENAASVQLLLPERRLIQMHVEKARYIKRTPLTVPNKRDLLLQTTNKELLALWSTTEAYETSALRAMVNEANRLCGELGLPEKLPIQRSNLTKIWIDTPFVSERLGRFGTICTENYTYTARCANKLASISRYTLDEHRDLYHLKMRWRMPRASIDTNAAYAMATQWLAAVSVDVKEIERNYRPVVHLWDLGHEVVPLYTVQWIKGDNHLDSAATVEVLEPERSLRQLSVERPEYFKRPRLLATESGLQESSRK